MKYKILLMASLVLSLFVRAQTDSSVSKIHFILKTNPTLAATSGDIGELGASLELNIGKRFGAFVGYGYNTTTPVNNPPIWRYPPGFALNSSNGNTIRAGIYYFFGGRKFLSAQMFYRTWQPTTVFEYVDFNVTTDYATNKFGNSISSDESASAAFTVNNNSVTTTAFDILFGNQIISNPNEGKLHLFFGMVCRYRC